jgi:diguanylate cyclase (GGDEF)-like protein
MNESNPAAFPTVSLLFSDAMTERRLREFAQREKFAECTTTVSDVAATASFAEGAALLVSDKSPPTNSSIVWDYLLPTSCGDAELRTAVRLLAKIAALRGSLQAARRSEDALQQLAATDPLTGLANRRAWDDELARLVRAAAAGGEPFVTAIVDLDLFKQVNDAHGHAVGDAVLRATADGLRRAIRRGDTAARLGGDEFGLLLSGLQADRAAPVVERIRLSAIAAVINARLPSTTCSFGYVAEQGSGASAETIYAAAATALQAAKHAGRDRVVCG